MKAYDSIYPRNFIVLIGDENDFGLELGMLIFKQALKSRVCLLKGGIDAARIECP